jgi:2',3'-cyclic-nucleotide 2'-phosphodiesterase (5'-nucleotidase family)
MDRMGYQVVNVGERDVRMGFDEFEERTAKAPFDFISANIIRQDTQQSVFKPYAIVEAASPDGKNKRRVGVIGIVRYNPIFLKAGPEKSNIVIDQPTERVRAAVTSLEQEGVDVIVLLSALHKADVRRLVGEVAGIDYVLGSYGGVYTQRPERVGETWMLYAGNRGQRVVESRLFLDEPLNDVSRVHYLTRDYPHDQPMLDFVNSIPAAATAAEAAAPAPATQSRSGS